ncbi:MULTISPECIES: LysR family transcriptional regulator [Rhizobium]|uniref:Transcriptional regulator NodD5 n=5 Tax=Rhizobium TaxID=379 RepID=N6U8Y6_9HYPH|nr:MULTISPECIES: LysR family transcriptional regulator [Rhizobium]AGB73408.1 transcriptional regulator NodD5 [Rhizobium tropici CIAT 899]ENN86703.1 transcriptional regulator NodD5 [Rhizobium freirei PRF 81]NEV15346.1 LysR family transcriptional regulator [Rhizobium tropici]TGE87597.1 LysR family transcriptional regulator [Rhizobium sp. SEMIA 4088]SCB48558.1 LysR family transcriptional regulator, nod-box dependent transcriptional activator [Rhizobium lusitanum]
MRFNGLDLNLLVALDALMSERNLTAAARSINLSQPAMSAAVARLRTYFQDELFTMAGREFIPTRRAEGIAPAVREALLQIQLSIISREPFDPARSDRRFKIVLSDYVTLVFFERIAERVAREAPGVSFEFLPPGDDNEDLLRRGDVDFFILPEIFLSNAHPQARLFDDVHVCVGCTSNKQLEEPFTFERYMSMGHVVAKFYTRRPGLEDSCLLEHGRERRIDVVVHGFSMIPSMVSGNERIGTMPLRLAQHFARTMPLRIVELPLPRHLPFTEAVQWHELHNSDPGSVWMREMLFEEASRMVSPIATTAPLSNSNQHECCPAHM